MACRRRLSRTVATPQGEASRQAQAQVRDIRWLTNSHAPAPVPNSTFPPDRALMRHPISQAKEERIMVISRGIAGVLAGILVAFTFAIAMGGL